MSRSDFPIESPSRNPKDIRYLWAVGDQAMQIPTGELVAGRYQVVSPQIWQDTQPTQLPEIPRELPAEITPYLELFGFRLHLPQVYGYAVPDRESDSQDILLLENVPVTETGNLYPSIIEAWSAAKAVRRVYWLWQMMRLWSALSIMGVASSLLVADNIRVQGWRVWLRELYLDSTDLAPSQKPSLKDLGAFWWHWISENQPPAGLQAICQQLSGGEENLERSLSQLNQILVELAARLPLSLEIAGASDTGPRRSHNEDTCYPLTVLPLDSTLPDDDTVPGLAIVCDGIGGHEGGEVASQLAVRTIQLQIRGLLAEVAEQTELVGPLIWMEHLESVVRIVNNLIATQNDEQKRESRQRMGTTLAMVVQIPQKVGKPVGLDAPNSHEFYLIHVGDSRAYWITRDYCQLLTVDDNVLSREVRTARLPYQQALRLSDSQALTQALGTRDADFVRPNIQRLIVEEDGVLLLCSDGLSDNGWVEKSWTDYAPMMLDGNESLDAIVQAWIDLANQKNGHDNTSVVLMRCFVSPKSPVTFKSGQLKPVRRGTINASLTSGDGDIFVQQASLAIASEVATAAPETVESAEADRPQHPAIKGLSAAVGLLALLIVGGTVGLLSWWQFDPQGFWRMYERLPQSWRRTFPAKPQVSPESTSSP